MVPAQGAIIVRLEFIALEKPVGYITVEASVGEP